MKNIIIAIALHFYLQNVFAQDVQLLLTNVPKELALYEQFTVDCQLINNDTISIPFDYYSPLIKLYYLDNSSKRHNLNGGYHNLYYNLNALVYKDYYMPPKLEPGDTIIIPQYATFIHPVINDVLEEEMWKMQSIQIEARVDYRNPFSLSPPLIPIISPPIAIKIKPFPKEEQAYFNWLNKNNISIRSAAKSDLKDFSLYWDRKSSKDPKLFHDITSEELDTAIRLFPTSLLLAETIDCAIGRRLIPNSHITKALLHIGQIKNQGLIQKNKPIVNSICNILNNDNLIDIDIYDHSCEAYKTLAPLYGLSD